MKIIFAGAGILLAGYALYGQGPVTYYGTLYQFAFAANGEAQSFGTASIGSQVVTGKPFSANEERHSIQILGDGTHIETKETNRLFRDDQGRTRIERSGGAVTIMDPVTGFTAELHPGEKTFSRGELIVREGRVVGRGTMPAAAIGVTNPERARIALAKLESELAQARASRTEGNPDVKRLEAQLSDARKAGASQFHIEELKAFLDNYPGEYAAKAAAEGQAVTKEVQVKMANGASANLVLRIGPGDNGSVDSLPAQMVNGAMSEGSRTTETIPVGKIGNDRPIVIVNERWTSSDLQMLVKSTSSDPRFGDTIYQLTNIVQSAPDPSLFQIPADYTARK